MQVGLIVHVLITDQKGRFLILKRSSKNDVLPEYWDIPGGTLEAGEDPSAGAIRETKEETDLNVFDLNLFFQRSNFDAAKSKQFVTLVFFTKYNGGEICLNPDEHDEFAWIKQDEIEKFMTVDYLPSCIRAYVIRHP